MCHKTTVCMCRNLTEYKNVPDKLKDEIKQCIVNVKDALDNDASKEVLDTATNELQQKVLEAGKIQYEVCL